MTIKSFLFSLLTIITAAIVTTGAVNANPQGQDYTPSQQERDALLQFKAGMDKLLVFMRQPTRPAPDAIVGFVKQEIAPFFDFDQMAQAAGGRMYADMSTGDREAMAQEMEALFLTRLAQRLTSFSQQTVTYLTPNFSPDGQFVLVNVMIGNNENYPARVSFRLYKGDRGWKVYDVAANGQSAVVHYRNVLRQRMMQWQMRERYQRSGRGAYGQNPYAPR